MFQKGQIWAYPTDTSFGLGVRVDDPKMLLALKTLKRRSPEKYFSLMVKDWDMLQVFAEIPHNLSVAFFEADPVTVILTPSSHLPKTEFWPEDKVAFRICTIPQIAKYIECPITATSANISGQDPLYNVKDLKAKFKDEIQICDYTESLPLIAPSAIWDFTQEPPQRLR